MWSFLNAIKRSAQAAAHRGSSRQSNVPGDCLGKLLSPHRKREAVSALLDRFRVSERRACRVLKQPRATQRYLPIVRDDELPLTQRIIELACMYGRYGYRRITALLRWDGWFVNHKRVERIWKREGLKVPKKQPKRGRLHLADGSCIRLRPEHKDHVWSYDFVQGRTNEGRSFRMLTVIDKYTRECLAIDVARNLKSDDVLKRLVWLMADLPRRQSLPQRPAPLRSAAL